MKTRKIWAGIALAVVTGLGLGFGFAPENRPWLASFYALLAIIAGIAKVVVTIVTDQPGGASPKAVEWITAIDVYVFIFGIPAAFIGALALIQQPDGSLIQQPDGFRTMNAADAALEAARLGLIGTIAVGVLAALTTIAGTVLAPFLVRRSEQKAAEALRRRSELAEVIPEAIETGIRAGKNGSSGGRVARALAAQAKLGVLLGPEEWQIAAIARSGLMPTNEKPETLRKAVYAAQVITAWARGELTVEEAADIYERRTGVRVGRLTAV